MADSALLRELNDDVWHPFRRTYAARDTAAFLALHTPDLIRVGGPERHAHTFAEYAARIREWFAELTERGDQIEVDFRFEERIAAGELASERGIFQVTVTPADGAPHSYYGRFHAFSRKVDGRWRLAVDYDSTDGGTVTADTFQAGAQIDDLARFETT